MTAAGRYRLLGPDSVPADDEWIGRLRTPVRCATRRCSTCMR